MTARPTRLEIDLGAIADNIRLLRARLAPGARYLAVVKADAYGHGARDVLKEALCQGAWGGAVALPEEGAQLRDAGIDCPVLVLGGADAACARAAVEYGLSQAAPDVDTLRLLSEAARALGRPVRAHIKLDTGMGRIGVRHESELDAMLDYLSAHPEVELEGVFTHFARADECGADAQAYTRAQARRFTEMCGRVTARGFSPIRHMANSAAMLRYPEYDMDMVRMGVSLYGFSPFVDGLRYAQHWVTRVMFAKRVPEGTPISYGGTFITARESLILTLPVGYADGYLRAWGNKACVLVRGQRAPVVGRVCMDQIMVDATDIPGAGVGDEAVLLGAQGAQCITPEELARIADTIPYEVMVGVHSRVPRVTI